VFGRTIRLWHTRLAGVVVLLILLAGGIAHGHDDTYPMPAAAYRKRAAERFERYEQRLELRMREHEIPEARRRRARARMSAAVKELRALVEAATRDGTVTKPEADRIKTRGKELRATVYRELGLELRRGE
jgi:hypothetical protein